MSIKAESRLPQGISDTELRDAVDRYLAGRELKKVLIIGPDFTRFFSGGGHIANIIYHRVREKGGRTDVLIAQGTHAEMTEEQFLKMYGDIPFGNMIPHRWKEDTVKIGEIPASYIREVTGGLWDRSIVTEVNRRILDPSYDMILSVGQVVPHEIAGMSNYSKNIFVGIGGSDMINQSHIIGAVYGMERIMGRDHTPVREIYDYALKNFLHGIPLSFCQTVTTAPDGKIRTHGIYFGEGRDVYEDAVRQAAAFNFDYLDGGIRKCVVYLDPGEFKTIWLGNKAIYRTRMAMADGGELIVLAPGITHFGEDEKNDAVIRKYGYCGRKKILELLKKETDLQENMGAAAHLIHGSSDGRFTVTYAVKNMSRKEIESVHFHAADYDETVKRYPPDRLKYGWNEMPDGERIFFIPNPALGLWADRTKLN